MTGTEKFHVVDVLTLRFVGENTDGSTLHELQADHVSDVLEGLFELLDDMEKDGVFHAEGVKDSSLLVRPPKEGSFLLEVVRVVQENPDAVAMGAGALGIPSLGTMVWAVKQKILVGVKDYEKQVDGHVKVVWTDDTVSEVTEPVWNALRKRPVAKRRHLRKIMAPLADTRVQKAEVSNPESTAQERPSPFELDKIDYQKTQPDDSAEKVFEQLKVDGKIAALDFDNPNRWRIRANGESRIATVEDEYFLQRVGDGLQIGRDDVFRLTIEQVIVREDNQTKKKWTVTHVDWEEASDEERDAFGARSG